MNIDITEEMLTTAAEAVNSRSAVYKIIGIVERDYTIARRWVQPPDDPSLCGAVSPTGRMTCRKKKGHDPDATMVRKHWGFSKGGARRFWQEWLH